MDKQEPPQAFTFEGNVSHSWKLWLKHFDFYLVAIEEDTKHGKQKTYILLTYVGQKGREIYETFTLETSDEIKLALVLHKFSEYCNPWKKTIIHHQRFFTYRQHVKMSKILWLSLKS